MGATEQEESERLPITFTDEGLTNLKSLMEYVGCEDLEQIKKWGFQTRTAFEWLTYATEELGELAKAISEYVYRNGSIKAVTKEAIQLATLSLKIAEMFRKEGRRHGKAVSQE